MRKSHAVIHNAKIMLQNKLLKNNLVYMASVVLGGVLGYLFHFVISRRLSVGEYGELQAIISVTVIFGVFFSAFSLFTIKNSSVFALHNDREGQVKFLEFVKKRFRHLILAFLVSFLILLPAIKFFLHLHDYWGILLAGLSVAISFYAALYSNSFQGWSDFFIIGVIGVSGVLAKLASGYVLALFFPSASAVAGSLLISAVVSWLIAREYFRKKWPRKKAETDGDWRKKYFDGVSFKKSLLQILFFSFGLAVISNVDILLVKNLATSQIAGYYAALSVLGKTILWLSLSVAMVLFPEACADGYCGKPAKRKSILGSYALILLISLPAICIFYFFPNFLVGTMFGSDYLSVAPNLWLFGLMAFALSLLTLESKLALARYDFKSTGILFATLVLMGIGVGMSHSGISTIVISVSSAILLGWLMMFSLNLFHRLRYVAKEKENQIYDQV